MVKKELKDHIQLIRTLKEAQDEAEALRNRIGELHSAVVDVTTELIELIKRVNELDKEVTKEEEKK